MRLLIAGSRSWSPTDDDIAAAVATFPEHGTVDTIACVICGEANGADLAGKRWARDRGISVESHPAEWSRLGKRAGFVRNEAMGDACSHAIIFRDDGVSNGTDHMLSVLRRLGRPFVLVTRKGLEYVLAPHPLVGLWRSMSGAAVEAVAQGEPKVNGKGGES